MARKKIKHDLNLMKKIRDAETSKKPSPVKVEIREGISFDEWWIKISHKIRIQSWMKEIIAADFNNRGLSDIEKEEVYNDALVIFGIELN